MNSLMLDISRKLNLFTQKVELIDIKDFVTFAPRILTVFAYEKNMVHTFRDYELENILNVNLEYKPTNESIYIGFIDEKTYSFKICKLCDLQKFLEVFMKTLQDENFKKFNEAIMKGGK